jgi:hypothetical protein
MTHEITKCKRCNKIFDASLPDDGPYREYIEAGYCSEACWEGTEDHQESIWWSNNGWRDENVILRTSLYLG